ncbi:MAG: hypothetical protein H7X94_11915, partial [Vallitaleaceae bacterium]|nr:hypothetical protein [Vallitaleaceae bacterium]
MKSLLTSRERILLALDHKDTDRVPFSLGFGLTLPAKRDLQKYMGMQSIEELDNYLLSYSDLRWIGPEYCGPKTRNIVKTDGSSMDVWGVERSVVGHYDEISHYPLAKVQDISELNNYLWPQASWANTNDIKRVLKEINKDEEYAIVVGNGNIFESSWYMRGMEQMMMDLIIEPELSW